MLRDRRDNAAVIGAVDAPLHQHLQPGERPPHPIHLHLGPQHCCLQSYEPLQQHRSLSSKFRASPSERRENFSPRCPHLSWNVRRLRIESQ